MTFFREIRSVNDACKAIIMVLDNFSTHVSNRVKKEADQLGIYLVYLPPYSPDPRPDRVCMEEHQKSHLDSFCG
ncbi:MAG: transposase [Methanosarcinales archaeon]